MKIYATNGTAAAIAALGIDVTVVNKLGDDDSELRLLAENKLGHHRLHGRVLAQRVRRLHHAAPAGAPVLGGLPDLAGHGQRARGHRRLADTACSTPSSSTSTTCAPSGRKSPSPRCRPAATTTSILTTATAASPAPSRWPSASCDRHRGIGGDGIVLIEQSDRRRRQNAHLQPRRQRGPHGGQLHPLRGEVSVRQRARQKGKNEDRNGQRRQDAAASTTYGNERAQRFGRHGQGVAEPVGRARHPRRPRRCVDRPVVIGGREYRITCVSMGNPHCVVFCDRVDAVDVETVGPQFENAPTSSPSASTPSSSRVVNRRTLKMRVWERGNGETLACGTGACAAVVAAVENGYCDAGRGHHRQGARR